MITAVVLAAALAAPPRITRAAEPAADIGGTITLHIENAAALPRPCPSLELFIEALPMHGILPDCSRFAKSGDVAFPLDVDDDNVGQWHRILGRPGGLQRKVSIAAGWSDSASIKSDVNAMPLRVLHGGRLGATLIAALALLGAIVVLRVRTSLLDNLPRLQIAIWLFVIALAWGFIWSATGETETINGTALALVGIGAATTLGAAVMKSAKKGRVGVGDIAGAVEGGVAAPVETPVASNLHSLQAAVFTVVMAYVFLVSVYRHIEMPDFGGNVLLLLGISGGTYVAFSFPKNRV